MPTRSFSTDQVARILGASDQDVRGWMEKGWLPYHHLPDGTLRISEMGLVKFLKDRGVDIGAILANIADREGEEAPAGILDEPPEAEAPAEPPAEQAPEPARQAGGPGETAEAPAPVAKAPRPTERPLAPEPAAAPADAADRTEAEEVEAFYAAARKFVAPAPSLGAGPPRAQQPADLAAAPPAAGEQPPAEATEGEATGEKPLEPAAAQPPAEEQPAEAPAAAAPPEAKEAAEATEPPAPTEGEPEPGPTEVEPEPAEAEPAEREPMPAEAEPEAVAAEAEPAEREAEPAAAVEETPTPLPGRGAQIAEAVLGRAVADGATDVYLQPSPQGLRLRLRVGGVVREKRPFRRRLPAGADEQVVAYFRSLVGPEPDAPVVKGRLERAIGDRTVRLDIGSWPTVYGPAVAVAINDVVTGPQPLDDVGLAAEDISRLRRLLAAPGGLFVVACPAARDTRRLLRAVFAEAALDGRHALTIERPGAVPLEGAIQSSVDRPEGYGFAEAAQLLAQQNPDALLIEHVGEPRTALAAVDAAEQGATVVAGMRSPSAASAVQTLVEMGCEPWPLADALRACVAQASVRELCPDCQEPDRPNDLLLRRLGLEREDVNFAMFFPSGCPHCGGSGYVGSVVLRGVVYVAGAVRRVVREGGGALAVRAAAEAEGMTTLHRAGLAAVRDRRTSLVELARVLASD